MLNDNQVLTNDLILSNREVKKLKMELKQNRDGYKKSDKEKLELKKLLESKISMLDKVKQERDELSITICEDRYKSKNDLEQDMKRAKAKARELEI